MIGSTVIHLDAAAVLLQWATGGLAFLWVTSRRREVGIGYGWLLRGTYLLLALGALIIGLRYDRSPARDICSALVVVGASVALAMSIARRRAGVLHQRERVAARTARVAAMTGIERAADRPDPSVPEFPPVLDLVAPAIGVIGCIAAGVHAGDPA